MTKKISNRKDKKKNNLGLFVRHIAGLCLSLYLGGGCTTYTYNTEYNRGYSLRHSNRQEQSYPDNNNNLARNLEIILQQENNKWDYARLIIESTRERVTELIRNYEYLITVFPDFGFAYNLRGVAKIRLGEEKEGIDDIITAMRIDKDSNEPIRIINGLGFELQKEDNNIYLVRRYNSHFNNIENPTDDVKNLELEIYVGFSEPPNIEEDGEIETRNKRTVRFREVQSFRKISAGKVLLQDRENIFIIEGNRIKKIGFNGLYDYPNNPPKNSSNILFTRKIGSPLEEINMLDSRISTVPRINGWRKRLFTIDAGIVQEYSTMSGKLGSVSPPSLSHYGEDMGSNRLKIDYAYLEVLRMNLFSSRIISPYFALGRQITRNISVNKNIEEDEFELGSYSVGVNAWPNITNSMIFPRMKYYYKLWYNFKSGNVIIHNNELIRLAQGNALIHSFGPEVGVMHDEVSGIRHTSFLRVGLSIGKIKFKNGKDNELSSEGYPQMTNGEISTSGFLVSLGYLIEW